VYAVLLFPMLMLVLALVLAVGTIEGLRTRLRAQLDMAALTATQALDPAALAAGEPPRLQAGEAERLAREYLARNLAATGDVLVASPSEIAAAAQVVISNEPGTDPITRAEYRPDREHRDLRAGPHPAPRSRRDRARRDAHDRWLGSGEDVT
jgi:hypothetical protein